MWFGNFDLLAFSLELFQFVLAGCLVALLANWLFWRRYNAYHFRMKMLEYRRETSKDMLPLRLQAHERLVLFVERIQPADLLLRLHEPGLSAQDFQQLLISEVRSEYRHNVVQQLYVSDQVWKLVAQLKDQTVALIRSAHSGLSPDAKATDLSKTILAHMAEMEENPYQMVLSAIKDDLG